MEQVGRDLKGGGQASRECPECYSRRIWKDGVRVTKFGTVQRFLCRDCGFRFSEKSNIEFGMNRNHQLCAIFEGAKKLETVTEIQTVAGEKENKQEILLRQLAFHLKKEGTEESTIETYSRYLLRLNKLSNLEDPETVKTALANMNICENTKVLYCYTYEALLEFIGKTWIRPKYQYQQKLPEFIPTEEELKQLIAGATKKVGTLVMLIMETGMRISECLGLTWTSIDFKNDVITLTKAKKNSRPRIFSVSNTLLGQLGRLPRKNEKVFGKLTRNNATTALLVSRKRVGIKAGSERIAKIHFHLIRHWYGTMLYHKTKDIYFVNRQLRQKSLQNTLIYINLEQALFLKSSNDYHVKVASNVEEAVKLVEVGFEFVADMNGQKIFRKLKL